MISKRTIRYCCEDISKIENYDEAANDPRNIWQVHHRLETHDSDGNKRPIQLSKWELEALGMYYSRPASELIFLTIYDHTKLHSTGHMVTDEMRNNIISKQLGRKRNRPAWNKGLKLGPMSDEQKARLSEIKRSYFSEHEHWCKGRKLSEVTKTRISNSNRTPEVSEAYRTYRTSGGTMNWNEFQKQYWRNK